MVIRLNALPEGHSATVKAVCIDGAMRRRLFDFGLIEGTEICCLRQSSCKGPSLFWVRGTMLALRRTDSANICVEACE